MNPLALNTNSTSSTGSAGSAPQTAGNTLSGNDFMTLLTTQLQSQDPTQPEDPNELVDQLVSFNSLQQLISINQGIQTLTSPAASGSGSTSGTSGSSGASGADAVASAAQAAHVHFGKQLTDAAQSILSVLG